MSKSVHFLLTIYNGNQGGQPHAIIQENEYKLIHYWEDGHNELYNVFDDSFEDTNLANTMPDITQQMERRLLLWLEEMNVKYAQPDPLYDANASEKLLEKYRTELMPSLEKKRKAMLQTNWKPNKNWWGSDIEKNWF